MKKYVFTFMAIFSFFTMFFAPFLSIAYFPQCIIIELVLSVMNAVCISAIFVDLSIGIASILLPMRGIYEESKKNMQSWIIIAFLTSIVQYTVFLLI